MNGSNLQPLLLRADASTQIGAGHVMRCLALAQAWQDAGGVAHFAAAELPDGLAARLTAEGMALYRLDVAPGSAADAVQTAALARQLGADWVVEDGYKFGADFQRIIKEAGLRLLAIDDCGHAGHYVADLVLNQNIYANESLYPSREPCTRLLLGTQYVLLRREFQRWRGWQREIPDVARRVLVTMGGGDPDNVTSKVIEALEWVQVDGLEVAVVVGASNPHLPALQDSANRSVHVIRLVQDVSDMSELVAWADLAVVAGGSTCWEIAFMGLPSIIIVIANNQEGIANGLGTQGAGISLGSHTRIDNVSIVSPLQSAICDRQLRTGMCEKALRIVDSHGTTRTLASLLDVSISAN